MQTIKEIFYRIKGLISKKEEEQIAQMEKQH